MKVTVVGCGYVGLVTGSCLAQVGHEVICLDTDAGKIDQLRKGHSPVAEPGLEGLISTNIKSGLLQFSSDKSEALPGREIIFIAVGTPGKAGGGADVSQVLGVAADIGRYLDGFTVIVTKSTAPVGTAQLVGKKVAEQLRLRGLGHGFEVACNPEFLKEGTAVADFMKPDRIVLGTRSVHVKKLMRQLYAPFNRNHERLVVMDIPSAEFTKYAANAMLATKISFINEMANIAEKLDVDIEEVRQGIGADPRIGYHFIYPGCGYGGSCFPKDIAALQASANAQGYDSQLLHAVEDINSRQRRRLFDKIDQYFGNDLKGKVVALWGLAFKPNTDDMREAPSRELMECLWAAGAKVRAYDPGAMSSCQRIYGEHSGLKLVNTKEEALFGADVLAICTEWKSFWAPDFGEIHHHLSHPVIFDGRNLYDPAEVSANGLHYIAIGRSSKAVPEVGAASCQPPVRVSVSGYAGS